MVPCRILLEKISSPGFSSAIFIPKSRKKCPRLSKVFMVVDDEGGLKKAYWIAFQTRHIERIDNMEGATD